MPAGGLDAHMETDPFFRDAQMHWDLSKLEMASELLSQVALVGFLPCAKERLRDAERLTKRVRDGVQEVLAARADDRREEVAVNTYNSKRAGE